MLQLNTCQISAVETANRVAEYINALRSNPAVQPGDGSKLEVGSIEPMPAFNISTFTIYLNRLIELDAKPSFFHVDLNGGWIDRNPQVKIYEKLKALHSLLKTLDIPFGLVLWPGYDPVSSDQSYYRHVIDYATKMHVNGLAPERLIFESWVRRAGPSCDDTAGPPFACSSYACGVNDGPSCMRNSVPNTLPEGNSGHSHTRLIVDTLALLAQPPPILTGPVLNLTGRVAGFSKDAAGVTRLNGWACARALSRSVTVELYIGRESKPNATSPPTKRAGNHPCIHFELKWLA
jgi:hypothetical protein